MNLCTCFLLKIVCVSLDFISSSPKCHSQLQRSRRFSFESRRSKCWLVSFACTSEEMLLFADVTKHSINLSFCAVKVLVIVLTLIYFVFGGKNQHLIDFFPSPSVFPSRSSSLSSFVCVFFPRFVNKWIWNQIFFFRIIIEFFLWWIWASAFRKNSDK